MSVSELQKMMDQEYQKRSTEFGQLHLFNDGNLENLLFLDEILITPHDINFKQINSKNMKM